MKLILVGHPEEELRSTLELILKNWGYRVMAAASIEHLQAFLRETEPDLLLLDSRTLDELGAEGKKQLGLRRDEGGAGLFLLHQEGEPVSSKIKADHILNVPLNIFALFEAVQNLLEKHPRKNLRLDMKLPGIVTPEGKSTFLGEVLSLSPRGLFVKIGCQLQMDQRLKIVIPLMGIRKELEIEGKVLYQVLPAPENNYMQGAGIGFTDLSREDVALLEGYLESCLLSVLRKSESGSGIDEKQIHLHDREITVKLLRNGR